MQMDSFQLHNIKFEDANAILKYRKQRKIAKFFRLIEVCVVLVLISRLSTTLPVAVKNSGEYFRELSVVILSPRFVFIVGNVIIITLFIKSHQFSGEDSAVKNSSTDLYQEFVEKSEKSQGIHQYEIEYREKQSICEEITITTDTYAADRESKNFRRTQSDNLKLASGGNSCRKLRRSETEKYRKSSDSGDKIVNSSYPEDVMSNEEFRYKIEAFIARQKRFRKDEELSVI